MSEITWAELTEAEQEVLRLYRTTNFVSGEMSPVLNALCAKGLLFSHPHHGDMELVDFGIQPEGRAVLAQATAQAATDASGEASGDSGLMLATGDKLAITQAFRINRSGTLQTLQECSEVVVGQIKSAFNGNLKIGVEGLVDGNRVIAIDRVPYSIVCDMRKAYLESVEFATLRQQLATAEARVQRLESALKFYADEENYTLKTWDDDVVASEVQMDKGYMADSALQFKVTKLADKAAATLAAAAEGGAE